MSRSTRTFSLLAAVAVLPFAVSALLPACGGNKPDTNAPPMPSDTAPAMSTTATSATAATDTAPPASTGEPAPVEKKSKKADKKQDPAFLACHKDYKPTTKGKNLEADVTKLAKGCEKVTKMKLVGKTLNGKQGAEDKPQTFPLKASAGKCYRVYAESDPGITDLDMAIKDSNGDIAGEDSTDDPSPVVLEDGAVCFKEADDATVIVSVGSGKGAYVVQVWSE
jgi:hypothetical protein